ncbi:hypothetical protein Dda_2794 [Drechslerella dactyloides]|uniref:Glycine cleavage system H protein n=1 Tax=Drechslerella dactyloides TaxID=74499 RepID=A0AAD6J090_DREDA|nr:hypothetical protein Dda_2794 [Drechslerella dactyloides]
MASTTLRIASRALPRRLSACCSGVPLRRTAFMPLAVTPPSCRQFSRTAMRFDIVKRYTEDHEWVEVDTDSGVATIGITDFAQDKLGEVVYIELPHEGQEIEAGESLGAVESVKSASDVISPISGIIANVNSALEKKPALLNKDPEGEEGWIAKLDVVPEEVERVAEELMDDEAYKSFTTE